MKILKSELFTLLRVIEPDLDYIESIKLRQSSLNGIGANTVMTVKYVKNNLTSITDHDITDYNSW